MKSSFVRYQEPTLPFTTVNLEPRIPFTNTAVKNLPIGNELAQLLTCTVKVCHSGARIPDQMDPWLHPLALGVTRH